MSWQNLWEKLVRLAHYCATHFLGSFNMDLAKISSLVNVIRIALFVAKALKNVDMLINIYASLSVCWKVWKNVATGDPLEDEMIFKKFYIWTLDQISTSIDIYGNCIFNRGKPCQLIKFSNFFLLYTRYYLPLSFGRTWNKLVASCIPFVIYSDYCNRNLFNNGRCICYLLALENSFPSFYISRAELKCQMEFDVLQSWKMFIRL